LSLGSSGEKEKRSSHSSGKKSHKSNSIKKKPLFKECMMGLEYIADNEISTDMTEREAKFLQLMILPVI